MWLVGLQSVDEVVTSNTSVKAARHARVRCQVAMYTVALFTRGYGLANDTQQIHVVSAINGQPIGTYSHRALD